MRPHHAGSRSKQVCQAASEPRKLHPVFAELARGRKELEDWFAVAHCCVCSEFTDEPLFLHCSENHTVCEPCLRGVLLERGRCCPRCAHAFDTADPLLFKAHAHAMLNLAEVEAPDRVHELHTLLVSKRKTSTSLLDSTRL